MQERFELLWFEPNSANYIYFDENHNLHVLLPVVPGDTIGTDNTCKTMEELKQFFGLKNREKSAINILEGYKQTLINDIALLNKLDLASDLLVNKNKRLEQVNSHLIILKHIEKDFKNLLVSSEEGYRALPLQIKYLLQKRTNWLSMQLSPEKPDYILRTENPIFSLERMPYGFKGEYKEGLAYELRRMIREDIPVVKGYVEQISELVGNQFPTPAEWTNEEISKLIDLIQTTLKENYQLVVDCKRAYQTNQVIDLDYLKVIYLGEVTPFSSTEIAESILQASVSNEFWEDSKPSFFSFTQSLTNDEQRYQASDPFSIKVQFFLGQINIYCFKENLFKDNKNTNFGNFIDEKFYRDEIVECVLSAIKNNHSIEDELFKFINKNHSYLNLKGPLEKKDTDEILSQFNTNYKTIATSDHFDEFTLFYPDKPGDFFNHLNKISVDLFSVLDDYVNTRWYKKIKSKCILLDDTCPKKLPSSNTYAVSVPKDIDYQTLLKLMSSQLKLNNAKTLITQALQRLFSNEINTSDLNTVFTYSADQLSSIISKLIHDTRSDDEKNKIMACIHYYQHLNQALANNPKDYLALQKRDVVVKAMYALLTSTSQDETMRLEQFNKELIEGKTILCTRRDSYFTTFVKALGVIAAGILGLGVGGYIAFNYFFQEPRTEGGKLIPPNPSLKS